MWERERECECEEPVAEVAVTTIRRAAPTLGSVVSMLYHRMEAQPLGSWHTLEMTTTGSEMAWKHDNDNTRV